MKKILTISFLLLIAFSLKAQFKVKGDVVYASNAQTYLDSVTVSLKQGTTLVSQVNTDALGHYLFTNISNGTYTLSAVCNKVWGGCNSNDALAIASYYVNLSTLTGLRKTSADVNNSASINTLDALLAMKRFTKVVNSFASGDWALESFSITVNNGDITQNVRAICYGDANASFAPPATFTCGNDLVDTRDGQSYPTVLIGNQCWMAKNLNVGTFIYGVGDQTNDYVIEKYCYQNNTSLCSTYGGWYQWKEMMNYDTTAGGQGICPGGWHIPSDSEWDTLVAAAGGVSSAGAALKVGGSTGFNALMSGWVKDCQKFFQMTLKTNFWSSTQFYGVNAWSRLMTYSSASVQRLNTTPKVEAISVRCLKD
jgi:uncharacterized protein (TIGR02145 family)